MSDKPIAFSMHCMQFVPLTTAAKAGLKSDCTHLSALRPTGDQST